MIVMLHQGYTAFQRMTVPPKKLLVHPFAETLSALGMADIAAQLK